MLQLLVRPSNGEPFEVTFDSDSVVIGRSTTSDVPVLDRSMSRHHARLFSTPEGWMVEDLGSRNGTLVNGVRVEGRAPVKAGDEISMGASTIAVGGRAGGPSETGLAPVASVFRPIETILSETRLAAESANDREAMERYAARLRVVNEVHEAFLEPLERDELLDLILDRIFTELHPQQGAVFLKQGDTIVRVATRKQPGIAEDFPDSQNLFGEVIEKGQAALVLDLSTDPRFASAESMAIAGFRSVVAAPLLTPEGSLGMIALSANAAARRFEESDLGLLVPLASAAAMRLRNMALSEEAAERRRLEQELVLARRIQSALLPAALPSVKGYDLFASNEPHHGVSGDYYQVLADSGGSRLVVLIADVSGKGLGASLLTGYVDALCLAHIGHGLGPAEVLAAVSSQMYLKTPPDKFATALLGFIDVTNGEMSYCGAGHDPAIVVHAGGELEWLQPTGLPLGLLPEAEYSEGTGRLAPGDILVLYTDGICEAIDPQEEEYGRHRLGELCSRLRGETAGAIGAGIDRDLRRFTAGEPYLDDRTLVVVKRLQG